MLSGIFNVLKPPGMTSHDVVWQVRKIIGSKKVGHAGTLDPDAAGVLPVFVGDATRLVEYCLNEDKCYKVELILGVKTDTGDDSGNIIASQEAPLLTKEQIAAAIEQFTGEIWQTPPMYSAIKHEGKKLYQLAREGIDIERDARKITIKEIQLLHSYENKMLLQVECSKGTYIRTLVEDFAQALGTLATVSFLLRIRAGIFKIDNACTLEDIEVGYDKYLLPCDSAIEHLPRLVLTDNQAVRFCQGVKTTWQYEEESVVRVYAQDGSFLGIGMLQKELLKPKKVFKPVDSVKTVCQESARC